MISPDATITEVKPNDILVWNELEQQFVNVQPSYESLNLIQTIVKKQSLSPNYQIVKEVVNGDTLRLRGIIAGDNILITESDSDLTISVDMDTSNAETLAGFTHQHFVKVDNLDNAIDIPLLRTRLGVLTNDQMHDTFMEANKSNIPDKDMEYDLGSNGRRYSDVYAETFHGRATSAIISQGLTQNGASLGQILSWNGTKWVPVDNEAVTLSSVDDFTITSPMDKHVLTYNAFTAKWVNTDISSLITVNDAPEYIFSNTGMGAGSLHTTGDNQIKFKSFVGINGVTVEDNNGSEISIGLSASVFNSLNKTYTTDDIAEGTNLYFTKSRAVDAVKNTLTVSDLDFLNLTVKPDSVLAWDGTSIYSKVLSIPKLTDLIDTSTAQLDDMVYWDGSSLSFKTIPVQPVSVVGATDVDASSISVNDILVWDGVQFITAPIPVNTDTLKGIDTFNKENHVITWNGTEYILDAVDTGITLDDIDTSAAIDGYVLTWTGTNFVLREVGDGGTPVPKDTLAEVNTVGTTDGDVVTWNGVAYELREIVDKRLIDLPDVDIPLMEDGKVVTAFGGKFVLTEIDKSVSITDVNEFNIALTEGHYLTIENGLVVSKELVHPTIPENLTELNDVNIPLLENGKYLSVVNGSVVLSDLPADTNISDINELSNVNVLFTEGHHLTIENGMVVAKELVMPVVPESLADLNDVSTIGVSEGQVLTYQGGTYTFADTAKSITSLSEASDVTLTAIQANQILSWDGTQFINIDVPVDDSTVLGATDVDITNAINGRVLTYQNGTMVFSDLPIDTTITDINELTNVNVLFTEGHYLTIENGLVVSKELVMPTVPANITELNDVNIPLLENGKYLAVSGGSVVLADLPVSTTITGINELEDVSVTFTEGHVLTIQNGQVVTSELTHTQTLSELTDVSLANAIEGNALVYRGGSMVLEAITAPSLSLNDIQDVTLTSIQANQILSWNGTQFVNIDVPVDVSTVLGASDVDTTNVLNGRVLTYQNGTMVFSDLPSGSTAISDINELSNVNVLFTEGHYLTIESGVVVSKALTHTQTIAELTDVSMLNTINGNVLVYRDGVMVLEENTVTAPTLSLSELTDVTITTPVNGQALVYQNGSYTLSTIDTTATPIALADITDVDTSLQTIGSVLKWDGTSYIFDTVSATGTTSFTELSDVNVTSLIDGKYLSVQAGQLVQVDLPAMETVKNRLIELDDVGIDILEVGHYLMWNGTAFVLSAVDSGGATTLDGLTDVSTVGATEGQVLTYQGGTYSFSTIDATAGITSLSEASDVTLTTIQANQILSWNGTQFVNIDVPVDDSTVLGATDVDITNAINGRVLTYQNGTMVFSDLPADTTITDINELTNVNVLFTEGHYLTIENGLVVTKELVMPTVPENIIDLADVNIPLLENGKYLAVSGGSVVLADLPATSTISNINQLDDVTVTFTEGHVLSISGGLVTSSALSIPSSINDLADVTVGTPTNGQVLVWQDTGFVLADQSTGTGGGATMTSELSDVDSIAPNDGEVLAYDSVKQAYSPMPFPESTLPQNASRYEIVRVDYKADNSFSTLTSTSGNVTLVSVIDPDMVELEIQFHNYFLPPLSTLMYGYRYVPNDYTFTPVNSAQTLLGIDGLGTNGSPLLFDTTRPNPGFNMRISARQGETNASGSSDFPPEPTHAYLVFVMGV